MSALIFILIMVYFRGSVYIRVEFSIYPEVCGHHMCGMCIVHIYMCSAVQIISRFSNMLINYKNKKKRKSMNMFINVFIL